MLNAALATTTSLKCYGWCAVMAFIKRKERSKERFVVGKHYRLPMGLCCKRFLQSNVVVVHLEIARARADKPDRAQRSDFGQENAIETLGFPCL